MKTQISFHRELITEAVRLWLTLVVGIALGTGVTALLYTLGFSESSALTTGFIVMVVLFVLSETGYRTGWLPWKFMWRLNANARWALGTRRSHEDYYRRLYERPDQFRKTWELQLERDRDLHRKHWESMLQSLGEITQLGSDVPQISTKPEGKGEYTVYVVDVLEVLSDANTAKIRELDWLLLSLLQSLESEREVVETTRKYLEQQRELVGEILKRTESSEPG